MSFFGLQSLLSPPAQNFPFSDPFRHMVKAESCLLGQQKTPNFIQLHQPPELKLSIISSTWNLVWQSNYLDAGSNIGAFTIPVATMRRKVLAVDMMSDNLAYIRKSLQMANLTQYVQLIHNALRWANKTLIVVLSRTFLNTPLG